MTTSDVALPDGYVLTLQALKDCVRGARQAAQRTVNTQLIELYSNLGHEILIQRERQGWGTGVMKRLADDLRAEFPDMTGLSRSNLQYMRAFAAAWEEGSIVQQPVGQLPWGHVVILLDKLDTRESRDWYAAAALEYGWSRNVLANMIMNKSMERTGTAPSNCIRSLPASNSELAQQTAKDPCAFEFLGLSGEVAERDLEQALMNRIVDTLRELGLGSRSSAGRYTSRSRATTSTSTCCSSTSSSCATSSSNSKPGSSSPSTPAS